MARSGSLLLVLGEQLARRETWDSRAAVARTLGVGRATLAGWFRFLEFHRALREESQGIIRVHRSRLLSVLTSHRVANLRPEAAIPLARPAEEVHERLAAENVPHVMAMFTAANQWAFFEPQRDVHLYVERSDVARIRELLAVRPSPAHHGLLQAYTENLDSLPTATRQGVPVTSPILTVLDLRAHPEGGAHADFLERNLLPRLREAPA